MEAQRYELSIFIAIFENMKSLFFFLLLLPTLCLAQLEDNFSDGDFSNSPEWLGQTDRFVVTAGELQLSDAAPASNNESYLYLSAPTSTDTNTEWDFYVRQEFAPSTSNFARIYLTATQPDLTGDLNGYYLQIGGISGSDDALELYRQDGGSSELLLSATVAAVGSDPAQARVKISRSTNGTWELMADYTGGTNFASEGTTIDATYPMGDFFGVYCKYTSTRAESFFFDDVRIDPIFEDTTPPILTAGNPLSATEIELQFNEPLNATTAENTANYTVNNGIGTPTNAQIDGGDPSKVLLTLANSLISQTDYTVTATNISDINDNAAGAQQISFTFLDVQPAEPGDLIFTEVMADPNPPLGLPDAEYVELYNASEKVLQLQDMGFSSGSTPRLLPNYLISPGEYVVLCPADVQTDFAAFGPAIGLTSYPALTNGGDDLLLTDADGIILATLTYDLSWYQDADKEDGGWSLELIRTDLPSQCAGNWLASVSGLGGTPGQQNSVFGQAVAEEGPQVIGAKTDGPETLVILFDKALDPAVAEDIGNYQIDGGIGIMEALLIEPARQEVILTLTTALPLGEVHTLTFDPALSDCLGNPLQGDLSIPFAYTPAPGPNDLIITEFLPDPSPQVGLPDGEYIEIYNRSNQPIQLRDVFFSNGSSEILLPFYLLPPGEYVVICDLADAETYQLFGPAVGVEGYPDLVNARDEVLLLDSDLNEIFRLEFTLDWYEDAAKDGGGWSLELIDLEGPYDCGGNWRASEHSNGGTPGVQNSLLGQAPDAIGPELLRVYTQAPNLVVAVFNEPLDPLEAENLVNFSIDNGGAIAAALFIPELVRTRVALFLTEDLDPEVIYTLTISTTLKDCMGNALQGTNTAQFGLPVPAAVNDVVINEILFNPEVGGVDFVEFYNRSEKIIDLYEFRIGNTQLQTASPTEIINDHFQLLPNQYLVVTDNPADIQARYTVENPAALLDNNLPSFADDAGNVTLISPIPENLVIDAFDYTDDLHFSLLSDKGGVSLERLNPEAATQSNGNWHSAASTVGYATPTAKNSQFFVPEEAPESNVLTLAHPTFSPDEDGFEDVLQINYLTDRPGFSLQLNVYDAQGRLIRRLVRGELLNSGSGSFKWDGLDLEGQKARVGIYVIAGELTNPDGEVELFKESCVLATQF